jgi:hypothetical protein
MWRRQRREEVGTESCREEEPGEEGSGEKVTRQKEFAKEEPREEVSRSTLASHQRDPPLH